jgi:hypothetical protein
MKAFAPTTVRRFMVRQAHHEAVNVMGRWYHTAVVTGIEELAAAIAVGASAVERPCRCGSNASCRAGRDISLTASAASGEVPRFARNGNRTRLRESTPARAASTS